MSQITSNNSEFLDNLNNKLDNVYEYIKEHIEKVDNYHEEHIEKVDNYHEEQTKKITQLEKTIVELRERLEEVEKEAEEIDASYNESNAESDAESDSEFLDFYEKKINGKIYFITDDNEKDIYEKLDDGEVGEMLGRMVNNKAVFH